MLALSAALAAACFVKAFGVTFLGRPRTPARERAHETDRVSLAAMFAFAMLCLLAGMLPGLVHRCPGAGRARARRHAHAAAGTLAWLSIVPVAESRSSYNGLLVFVFITLSTLLTIEIIHRFASRALRQAPAWDCGFPTPSPATQYTADSFAQPIRRVFGTVVFRARERVDMPPPGDARPARLVVDTARSRLGGALRAACARHRAGDRALNHLQFLTIRQYLSLVFVALVGLLLVVSIWT